MIIISVKQPQLNAELMSQVKNSLAKDGMVLINQNGLPFYFLNGLATDKPFLAAVDPDGQLQKDNKDLHIGGILPLIAAKITIPGTVHITRPLEGIKTSVGLPANATEDTTNKLISYMKQIGLGWPFTQRKLEAEIMQKEQFALGVLTQSALFNKNLGTIYAEEQYQPFIKYCVTLTNYLSQKLGLDDGKLRDYETLKKVPITKEHYASLCTDINEQKENEVKAILDTILELATYYNIQNTKPLAIMSDGLQHRIESKDYDASQLLGELINASNEPI